MLPIFNATREIHEGVRWKERISSGALTFAEIESEGETRLGRNNERNARREARRSIASFEPPSFEGFFQSVG